MTGATKTGAVMLELVALVTAVVLTPAIVVLGLFQLAGLKRVEDLTPQADEWAAPRKTVGALRTNARARQLCRAERKVLEKK